MICPNCGHELSDHATLCPYCWSSWNHIKNDEQKAIRYCIHCGREIPVSAKFCPQCGTSCGPAIYKNNMEETVDDCSMEENVENYERFSNLSDALVFRLKNWKMVCANKRRIIFAIIKAFVTNRCVAFLLKEQKNNKSDVFITV